MNFSNVGTLANRDFTDELFVGTLQIEILQMNFSHVGTLANRDFTDELFKCGNSHKLRFFAPNLS